MDLPRMQLFEFNDLASVPAAVRDTVVESLSRMLAWGGVLGGLVEPLDEFLTVAGTREVLDIGAGAGGPAKIMVEEFRKRGRVPPRFLLTDLHPRVQAWSALRDHHPGAIDFAPDSVDATRVPETFARGRVRTIVNVLHHFPPAVARAIVLDAARNGRGVFIAEGFERNPLSYVSMWPAGIPALLLNPVLSPRDRLAKALLTYATPAAAAIALWDGVVSTLRVYNERELREMVAPLGDAFRWRYGLFK
ncbi:MAG: hypothetical protein WCJ30_21830, partial [Deltaproteobacteria bacterium]